MLKVDYFYSISSPWAFLGMTRLKAVASAHGAHLEPHLITIIEENGAIPVRTRPEVRRAYFYKDLQRWSEFHGLSVVLENRPTSDWVPASFMVIAALLDGKDWFALSSALQSAWWQEALDIGIPEVRSAIASKAGFDGIRLLGREGDDDVQARWISDRSLALEKGVFGVPTYICGDELFWGQDRLDFLDRKLAKESARLGPSADGA